MPFQPTAATQRHPDIEFAVITAETGLEVAEWCGGAWVHNFAKNNDPAYWLLLAVNDVPRSFGVGDYICKRYDPEGFYGMTAEMFEDQFVPKLELGMGEELVDNSDRVVFDGSALSCVDLVILVCHSRQADPSRIRWNSDMRGGKVIVGLIHVEAEWGDFKIGDTIIRKGRVFEVKSPAPASKQGTHK